MRAAAQEATSLLRALADAERLLVLCELSKGERSSEDLQGALGLDAPALAQHLNVLKNFQLVSARLRGRHLGYAVRDPRVLGVVLSLQRLFCAPAQKRVPQAMPSEFSESEMVSVPPTGK